MSYFDIIAGVILILAAFKGLKNGFIKELAGLAALILGIIFAVQFSDITGRFLSGFFHSQYMGIIAFLITFAVVVLAVHLIAGLLHTLLHAIALGLFNRLFGLVFGVLKAGFILSIILLGLDAFGLENAIITPSEQQRSNFYSPIKKAAPYFFDLMDEELDHLMSPDDGDQSAITI